jgi:hypothetical protein
VKGRHRTISSPAIKGLRVVAAAVAVLIVLGGSYYAYGKVAKPGCSDAAVRLSMAVAPELVQVVQAQAVSWTQSARVNGSCVAIDITGADSADIASAIAGQSKTALTGTGQASGKTKVPDMWVPDSSAWLLRLRTAKVATVPPGGTSIAKSPIVLAMPEPVATTFGWPQAKLTWTDVLAKVTAGDGKLKVGIVDPTRDSTGLAGLVALSTAARASGPKATEQATAALRALALGQASVRQEVLQRFPHATDAAALSAGLSVAPLSEQAVIAYNQTQPPVRLAALYVQPAPNALDYPLVTLPGATGDKATAAADFAGSLAGSAFRDRLAGIGMRGGDGTTGRGFQMPAGGPQTVPGPAAPPSAADGAAVEQLLQTWQAVALPARMLAVLDVSGSMLEKVPTAGNHTRMEVTVEAARKGLSLFDDKWAVGLWIFSTELDGPRDYKQLQPIGPLSAQRTQLLQSLAGIQPKRNGDTGLYDTILAGYKTVQEGYDEGAINSLVVMTDGDNDDKNGIGLDQLIADLQKIVDPKRPVSVILIGIGTSVGQAEMEKITNAIGGGTFLAPDPAKIGEIFLKAISLRTTPPK